MCKLKVKLRGNINVTEQTAEKILQKPTKTWVPNENHRTIKTSLDTIENGVKDEHKHTHKWRYSKPSKNNRKY